MKKIKVFYKSKKKKLKYILIIYKTEQKFQILQKN